MSLLRRCNSFPLRVVLQVSIFPRVEVGVRVCTVQDRSNAVYIDPKVSQSDVSTDSAELSAEAVQDVV
jgi:hypothetical protein